MGYHKVLCIHLMRLENIILVLNDKAVLGESASS